MWTVWTVCPPRLQLSHTLGVESGEHRVLRENSDQQQQSTHEISELLQAFLTLAPLPTIVSVCDCCSSAAGSWLIDR